MVAAQAGPAAGGDGEAGRGAEDATPFARHWAGLGAAERDQLLLDLVRGQAAAVLGHDRAGGLADDRPFRDLGFESLSGVELRNRLSAVTGLRLPAALVFNQPTPLALARHLGVALGSGRQPARGALADLERLEATLAAAGAAAVDAGIGPPDPDVEVIGQRLQALLWRWDDVRSRAASGAGGVPANGPSSTGRGTAPAVGTGAGITHGTAPSTEAGRAGGLDVDFDAMSDDEMLEAIDRELGAL